MISCCPAPAPHPAWKAHPHRLPVSVSDSKMLWILQHRKFSLFSMGRTGQLHQSVRIEPFQRDAWFQLLHVRQRRVHPMPERRCGQLHLRHSAQQVHAGTVSHSPLPVRFFWFYFEFHSICSSNEVQVERKKCNNFPKRMGRELWRFILRIPRIVSLDCSIKWKTRARTSLAAMWLHQVVCH